MIKTTPNTTVIETETVEDVLEDLEISLSRSIVLYNDDVNSFFHVIECLMKYCKHTFEQAEQCSLIVHNNGKCSVKSGSVEELEPIKDALCENEPFVKLGDEQLISSLSSYVCGVLQRSTVDHYFSHFQLHASLFWDPTCSARKQSFVW